MNVPDTSVIVPALAAWHPQHDVARRSLTPASTVVGHCLVEAYSVLTRLPEPHRMTAEIVLAALAQLFANTLVLDRTQTRELPRRFAAAGVHGGAAYDGLIACTAVQHEATLLTMDERAAGTYRSCGARFQRVGD